MSRSLPVADNWIDEDVSRVVAMNWFYYMSYICIECRSLILLRVGDLAVSPFPRPWIDVFALPEKFNMAVTESDLDPKVSKMSIIF